VDFQDALERFGFRRSQERRGGFGHHAELFVAQPNPFLTYTVYVYDDDTAVFSWEFAIGEYLATRGVQIGSDESLNQFAYPRQDTRGPKDGAWLAAAIDQAEALLSSVRLDLAGL
jgi:hypothetical protein